jgi:hypothetical protein
MARLPCKSAAIVNVEQLAGDLKGSWTNQENIRSIATITAVTRISTPAAIRPVSAISRALNAFNSERQSIVECRYFTVWNTRRRP